MSKERDERPTSEEMDKVYEEFEEKVLNTVEEPEPEFQTADELFDLLLSLSGDTINSVSSEGDVIKMVTTNRKIVMVDKMGGSAIITEIRSF